MKERQPTLFLQSTLKKAQWLIQTERVSKIAEDIYTVRSAHDNFTRNPIGGYMVEKTTTGSWKCVCKGFAERGICSHSLAVLMYESRERESNG